MNWNDLNNENHSDWYEYNGDSDTVIVFVHGLHSNKKFAWFYQERNRESVFWLNLIRERKKIFHMPSLYLANYYTAIDAGNYDIEDCMDATYKQLLQKNDAGKSVMDYNRIIFIGHSMGGIICRRILGKYNEKLKSKQIALILIASPSKGTSIANNLDYIINFSFR
jgi:triacylglycerol esterase/lipase EstA (alpha/beta hydrolase family)